MLSCGRIAPDRSRVRRRLAALAGTLIAGLLGACSMASSTLLLNDDAAGCSGSVGSYYLSKSYLQVVVTRDDNGKPQFKEVKVVPHGDRSSGYCLNFLASTTSKDTFVVQKDPTEQVLQLITSRAEDRSAVIADKVIQTVFRGLEAGAAGTDFRAAREEAPRLANAFQGEYDPFNEQQARLLNDGLKDTGFCLFLDDGSRRRPNMATYCDNPIGDLGRETLLKNANAYASQGLRRESAFQQAEGVLYRPRLPYTLYLFRNIRPDQQLPGKWALWQSETVYLENKSPTLAIAIDRTYFAQRNTTLRFASGVLQDVYIDKGSELAGAATIPLTIADNVAKLPSQLVKVRIDVSNRRTDLIRAQDDLIKAERALAADRLKLQSTVGAAPLSAPQLRAAADANGPLPGASEAATPDRCKQQIDDCVATSGLPAGTCAVKSGCQ